MANIERLRHWIEVLERAEKLPGGYAGAGDRFFMGCWALDNECGTVACALGWAGLDPEFQRQGLRTERRRNIVFLGDTACNHAAAEFFGISIEEANDVTSPWRYVGFGNDYGVIRPGDVIARIRKLIVKHEACEQETI